MLRASICGWQGVCPGLTHGQRYGISYVTVDNPIVDESSAATQVSVVHNSPDLVVSNGDSNSTPSDLDNDPDYSSEPNEDHRESQLEIRTPQIVDETDAKAEVIES